MNVLAYICDWWGRCLRESENALFEKHGGLIVLLYIILGWVFNKYIDCLSCMTAKITMLEIGASR